MGIDALQSQRFFQQNPYEIQDKKHAEELASEQLKSAQKVASDKLEISSDAKKLGPIINRLNEGFYDQPEILRETASRISKDIPPGSRFE
jgi:hypothetical protein